jgi:hypothetical protein
MTRKCLISRQREQILTIGQGQKFPNELFNVFIQQYFLIVLRATFILRIYVLQKRAREQKANRNYPSQLAVCIVI